MKVLVTVLEHLEYYVNDEYFSEPAVLLRGEWLCGKTFLCKEFMNSQILGSIIASWLFST